MKLYGIKTCDTCRKAAKALGGTGQDVAFVDLRQTPLDADQWSAFHTKLGDALLNTRSTTWRGLSEEERRQPVIDLLLAHPTLMKRPVIEAEDGRLTLGWGKDVQAMYLEP